MIERFQLLQINSQEMISTSYDQDQFSNSRLLDIPGSTQQEFAMGLNTFFIMPLPHPTSQARTPSNGAKNTYCLGVPLDYKNLTSVQA